MTREELKAHCEKQIEMCEYWANARCEKPSGKVYEEHKLILELLEQERFMNKPCVAHQVCHENKIKMLDKMKAEISCLPDLTFNRTKVLRIIDGYRIKSEVEE